MEIKINENSNWFEIIIIRITIWLLFSKYSIVSFVSIIATNY